jgi:hypothetical protein
MRQLSVGAILDAPERWSIIEAGVYGISDAAFSFCAVLYQKLNASGRNL